MFVFNEIMILILVFGCGIGDEYFDIGKLCYYKIVLMIDVDVDGSHICMLLLMFFYRQMFEIIEKGYFYIVQFLFYGLCRGKLMCYFKDEGVFNKYFVQNVISIVKFMGVFGQVVEGDDL